MAGVQILIVEDSALQLKLAKSLLEEAGNSVQGADSAEKALEILYTFEPDLILMDLQLPGKDGLELTRELRRGGIHGRTPIVAFTAFTHPSDLERSREAGCSGYIAKPIDTAAFARQVRAFLGAVNGAGTDVPSDSGDLLTGLRNNFLVEGLEQCDTILRELKSNPPCATERIERILHYWAGLAGTLGFAEISKQARRVEDLLSSPSLVYRSMVAKGVESARRRFCAAARTEPKLPADLVRGLRDARIGLVHCSAEEAGRIRTTAYRANVQALIEHMNGESIENQTSYDALVINECALSAQALADRPQWSIPAVFISSRAALESLSRLPTRAYDFLIAPWEAEEVLLRVYRLIGKAEPLQPAGDAVALQKRRPRVLVADDDPDMVFLVVAALGEVGLDCDVARSGQQALEAAGRQPRPDAMVLDVNMLDLDGFEVLKRLRRNLATKAIPVLMLTARRDKSDIAEGLNSGADDYVVKPFNSSDLGTRVTRMITARRRRPDVGVI